MCSQHSAKCLTLGQCSVTVVNKFTMHYTYLDLIFLEDASIFAAKKIRLSVTLVIIMVLHILNGQKHSCLISMCVLLISQSDATFF